MTDVYQHLGWPVSPYTAKTRAYLRFKGIPFVEKRPTAVELKRKVERAVGRAVMPTVVTPEGSWLQDTSAIIDELERRFPEPSVVPPGRTQRVASALLELHGDEWLPMVALHFRWDVPENHAFAVAEFGRYGFPSLPAFAQRKLGATIAKQMKRYMPMHGITAATIPGIDAFSKDLVAALDNHFQAHDFLLGSRPCTGDFALFGPLWAHLYRDPASTSLFDGAGHVRRWFDRLVEPSGQSGGFLDGDEVPDTLDPVFRAMFTDQLPFLEKLVGAIDAWCADHPDAERVPRALGYVEFETAGVSGERRLLSFTQWKVQRPVDAYQATAGEDRDRVDAWLARVGGAAFGALGVDNPLELVDFKVRLARPDA